MSLEDFLHGLYAKAGKPKLKYKHMEHDCVPSLQDCLNQSSLQISQVMSKVRSRANL
jgi:hypothetical protein